MRAVMIGALLVVTSGAANAQRHYLDEPGVAPYLIEPRRERSYDPAPAFEPWRGQEPQSAPSYTQPQLDSPLNPYLGDGGLKRHPVEPDSYGLRRLR